jgi:hypothetical protein
MATKKITIKKEAKVKKKMRAPEKLVLPTNGITFKIKIRKK